MSLIRALLIGRKGKGGDFIYPLKTKLEVFLKALKCICRTTDVYNLKVHDSRPRVSLYTLGESGSTPLALLVRMRLAM